MSKRSKRDRFYARERKLRRGEPIAGFIPSNYYWRRVRDGGWFPLMPEGMDQFRFKFIGT